MSTNAKAPIKGLIDVSVIAPGTVVYYKLSQFTVVKSHVTTAHIISNADVIGFRYSVSGCNYTLPGSEVFLTPEEAFKA